MTPAPGMGMEHKADTSEQGTLQAVVVYSLFPPNQGAEGNDFKDQKSDGMPDKGSHTSCHLNPILRPTGFCCFSLYFKQVKKGRDSFHT